MAGKTSMSMGEAVRIATAGLWSHKMRSVLTLLGVVIGVTSVIAVVSLVNGLNGYVAEKIFNLGADVFMINRSPSIITSIDQWEASQKRRKFHFDDYVAVRDKCVSCDAVAANVNKIGQVKYGNNDLQDTNILGFTHEMPEVLSRELAQGRYFTRLDVERAAPVCDVGFDVVDKLMPGSNPLGKEIRVDTGACEIIGVAKKRGSVMGQSQDNWVIMPLSTYQAMYARDDSVRIWVKAPGTAALDTTMDEVRMIVRARRHLKYRDADDFATETNASFLSIWSSISGTFFGVTIGIASISLIVGGIVIMNIMLVSVSERTREIGLRKSLGARQSDIQMQFLIESSTIALIGGAVGVFLGVLLAKVVTWTTALPSSVQLWSVLMGLLVATSVGLFFGVYPATKAARLDPVVALRADGKREVSMAEKTRRFGELKEAVALALDVLWRNPLRSLLTVLGIMIGVSTIIVIGAVINGLNSNVLGNISSLGSSTIIVSRISWATFGRQPMAVLQRKNLLPEWVDGVAQLPHVVAATPVGQIANYEVGAGSSEVRRGNLRAKSVILEGDGPSVEQISNFNLTSGRFFNANDNKYRSSVVVLGHTTAKTLFPSGEDPVGKEVLLEGKVFTVVGVLEEQKQALGTGDNPQDNIACVPYSVIQKLHPEFKDLVILAKADSTEDLPVAVDEVRGYMRRVRKLSNDKKDDFEIMTTDTFLELWNQISSGIFIVMLAVGSVALLVGGIGVMNIMLVSVTERTREIGVRKAIGARRSNILTQFLLEAVTLAGAGGAIGVLLGAALVLAIRLAFSSFPASVSLTLVLLGVSVASLIGIFFGVYPAWKAARLNPVEALRYE